MSFIIVVVAGRVEVYRGGEWGTVCGNWWWNTDKGAENICRQMGFSGGTR